ncbi:hypothetical protein [Aeromonas veronii]|uniref:hypothetical protein n=1 Tax=Aeromonas veronii TaxID=654 RepID=UPI003DA46BD4
MQFDTFIKQAAEKAAAEAHEVAATAYNVIKKAALDIIFRDGLVEELTEIAPELAAGCSTMQKCLNTRHQLVLQAAATELPWEEILALSNDPRPGLVNIIEGLQEQAKALEATADEKVRADMMAEKRELDARVRLGGSQDRCLRGNHQA